MTALAPPAAAALARRYRDAVAAMARAEAEMTALVEAHGGSLVIDGWRYAVETEATDCYSAARVDTWLVSEGYAPLVAGLQTHRCEGAARRLRVTREAM